MSRIPARCVRMCSRSQQELLEVLWGGSPGSMALSRVFQGSYNDETCATFSQDIMRLSELESQLSRLWHCRRCRTCICMAM